MNQTKFKNKYGPWALVTGASSGLGREIALRLGERGLNVMLHGRNAAALEEVAGLIGKAGGETKIITGDLSSDQTVDRVLNQTKDVEVGLFVAAAGFGTSGEFIKNSLDDELNMLDVNGRAAVKMTHHFAERFAAQKRGGIMLFGSLVGFQGTPYAAHYAATKAYMQVLGEGLRYELKHRGVDVLCVAPGPVATGFGKRANMNMNGAANPASISTEIVNALGRRTTVKPGFMSKFLLFGLGILPRWGRIKVMSRVMGGMTKHQRS